MGLTAIVEWLAVYLFAMLRIGAFLLASPAFGGRFVPLQVRIVATGVLALPVMAGGVALPGPADLAGLQAVPLVLTELAVGLVGGLVLTILFGAATLAGDRIAATAGLGFAAQYDPSAGGQTPVVAQLFGLFLTMVFFSVDGHLAVIRIVLESYVVLPPGGGIDLPRLVQAGLIAGGRMFVLGAAMMLPVVAALLLLNMAVGVLTRSAPTLNIFSFGFPVTMTVTLVLLYLTAPGLATALEDVVFEGVGMLEALLLGGGNG
ncbi:flagellar biosynthetic protein FliR [Rhodobacter sp. HX-7-19]|uniref:Flagellar biosynthetic protein FliR n=2 Tax=Paragemmobacter kunshanensis TaxID=2583234 RepID=A0A6M1U576_9RHOB|nr:flagellar biosynthetic protein FliR [Rhodobacter kunshanensis]